jgi:hypothetical protein
MRRRVLIIALLTPLVAIISTGVLALTWLHEPAPDKGGPQKPGIEEQERLLMEDPTAFAPVVGMWVKQIRLPLPTDEQMEEWAKKNQIAFLKSSIRRYNYQIQGYECTFKKQERLESKLELPETIAVKFREQPFSVFFGWLKGERLAKKVLFVRGQNNNMMLVKGAGVLALGGILVREPMGSDAKKSGRYPITEFGIKVGSLRTLAAWEAAQKEGKLTLKYDGIKKIKELGDRECYVIKRSDYAKPEEDGITSATFYFDKVTWLQVGSTLKNAEGELIAEYWFADVKLNPDFKPDTFVRDAVK